MLRLLPFVALLWVFAACGDDQPSDPSDASASQLTEEQASALIRVATVGAEQTAQRSAAQTAAAAPSATPRPSPTPRHHLALISASCTLEPDIGFNTCEGFVRNLTEQSLTNVLVVIEWFDANGIPRSSDDALIDYDPLLPGQDSPWSVISRYNPELTRYRVQFKELFGGTIPTRDER